MSVDGLPTAIVLCVAGLALVIFCAEKLVEGVVGVSLRFGVSAFVVSVVFVGFDPENLAVGVAGVAEGLHGIALGSVVGAAMVAVALAFGLTALIVPMHFGRAPLRSLLAPNLAVLLLGGLGLDGTLSRLDGALLLGAFAFAVLDLFRLSQRGLDIRPTGEVAEALEHGPPASSGRSLAALAGSLAGLVVGSELLMKGSERVIAGIGLTDTAYGMTILALAVSVEELARELPAALRGRSDISAGNVVGSVLAFFLFNAGIVAIVHPIAVDPVVLRFHLPVCFVAVAVVTVSLARLRVTRVTGAILLALYVLFFAGTYVQ